MGLVRGQTNGTATHRDRGVAGGDGPGVVDLDLEAERRPGADR